MTPPLTPSFTRHSLPRSRNPSLTALNRYGSGGRMRGGVIPTPISFMVSTVRWSPPSAKSAG
jgi:hypothetical protein